ncbi:MAG: ATP-grasp domain-containing protein [bacterium]|nr:ATP-grasp domain-containing protein [bacterium]
MNVLFFSPGFPAEMPQFVRGLAEAGARVFGLGDQPVEALPEAARTSLAEYERVESLWNEPAVLARVRALADRCGLDRIECLWEPGMLLAAGLREKLGLPGLNLAQTVPFRDKEHMKRVLDAHGIRTPRHARAATAAECAAAAAHIGFPLILKPIAGAGSADTHRVDSERQLEAVLPLLRHVPEVSVEEFIDGDEYTFDTISAGGKILYYNIAWYRPRPLIGRSVEWISPQTVTLRDPDVPELEDGRRMGTEVLAALGFRTGFAHMEWFRKTDGEVVFGEIGARPPGARSVDLMNYASDIDVFFGWAEAVCHGRFSQEIDRRYNAAVVFKRAQGQGRIQRIEGLDSLLGRYGRHVVDLDLLPIGAYRRDWRQTLRSDGNVIVRHPDLASTLEIADNFGTELQIFAG